MAMNMGTPAELSALVNILLQTLSPHAEPRRAAEAQLKEVSKQPNGPLLLLNVLRTPDVDIGVRLSASIAFKNLVKKEWDPESEGCIVPECKSLVKTHIVGLMCDMPETLMKQLSAALFTIGEFDFPDLWPELLPQIIEKLGNPSSDMRTINGMLETSNAIFKRFRHAFKSDALYKELLYCLQQFQEPLLILFTAMTQKLQHPDASLPQVATALRTMCRIFFSLNWQDLPEYFEDHMGEWMTAFEFLLRYEHAALTSESDDEADLLTLLHSAVLENVLIYAEKYEEEFAPYVQTFTQVIWQKVTVLSLLPKHDEVAAKSMKFLRSIAMQHGTTALFQQESVLSELCNNIVVRNLQLRESDVELFEDNPLEFIRRDIEGNDGDTRRSAATELLRGLRQKYDDAVSRICLATITSLLQEYAAAPRAKWMQKDVAINLVTALAAVKQTRARGVSEVHAKVPLLDIFTGHILPQLEQRHDKHPTSLLLTAGALKFVATFRNQLPVHVMTTLFPLLADCLMPDQFVVHTYAAYCIDRLLTVKDDPPSGVATVVPRRFHKDLLHPYVAPLLNQVFGILCDPAYPENDYLMRMVLRVLVVAQDTVLPLADTVVHKLTVLLEKVCKNPSNPAFSHCLFESLSMLIANVCTLNPALTDTFEGLLFPPFQQVLASDVEALCPYVYQVLAQLLDMNPSDQLSPAYMNLFPILLTPSLWERISTVPAIVKLLESYLRKAPTQMQTHITGILGVFQKLVSNRTTETHAFALLRPLLVYLPLASYQALLPELIKILMMRLQTRLAGRNAGVYTKEMVVTLSIFMAKHGAMTLVKAVESIQPGMMKMLVDPIWVENAVKAKGANERKAALIGLTLLVCDTPFSKDAVVLAKLFPAISKLLDSKEDSSTMLHKTEDEILIDLEETGYDAGFTSLHFASSGGVDYTSHVLNGRQVCLESISRLSSGTPGFYRQVAEQGFAQTANKAGWETLLNAFESAYLPFAVLQHCIKNDMDCCLVLGVFGKSIMRAGPTPNPICSRPTAHLAVLQFESFWTLMSTEAIVSVVIAAFVVGGALYDVELSPTSKRMHERLFRWRRLANWLPLGIAYSAFYMARYNVAAGNIPSVRAALNMTATDMGWVLSSGSWAYAFTAPYTGHWTDRLGGQRGVLLACLGSGVCNLLLGVFFLYHDNSTLLFNVLFASNVALQGFGTSAVVKIIGKWYAPTERGTFSGPSNNTCVFNVFVATGYYLALGSGQTLITTLGWPSLFLIPALLLGLMAVVVSFVVSNAPPLAPSTAPLVVVGPAPTNLLHLLRNRTLLGYLAAVFCLSWARDGLLNWMYSFFDTVRPMPLTADDHAILGGAWTLGGFVGGLLCGWISDTLFESKRTPPIVLFSVAQAAAFLLLYTFAPSISTAWLGV
ncbi:hypothetical protein As57867_014805, partial [Aphanomyces stellatus]